MDNEGPRFTGERRRLGFKLTHGRLSLRVLISVVTDTLALPEEGRGSAGWRPIVSLSYLGSVKLPAPLLAAEQW